MFVLLRLRPVSMERDGTLRVRAELHITEALWNAVSITQVKGRREGVASVFAADRG